MNHIKILQKNEFQVLLQDYVKKNYIYKEMKKLKFRNARRIFLSSKLFFWNPYYQNTINSKKKSVKI